MEDDEVSEVDAETVTVLRSSFATSSSFVDEKCLKY